MNNKLYRVAFSIICVLMVIVVSYDWYFNVGGWDTDKFEVISWVASAWIWMMSATKGNTSPANRGDR